MEKLKILINKFFTKQIIFYIIFGVLTTIVNIGTFYILTSFLNIEQNLSNNIAIIISILFAYFTNRKFVFNSTANTLKEKFIEFSKFILGRLFTMFIESFGFFMLFNLIGFHELISKLLINVIVIILNFFISKFFSFKKNN